MTSSYVTVTWQLGTILDKKKNTRDQRLLCAMQKEMGDICRFYCCSYFFLTGNDLGVMSVFFPENRDKTAGSLVFICT